MSQPSHQIVSRNGRSALHERNHSERLPQEIVDPPQEHLMLYIENN